MAFQVKLSVDVCSCGCDCTPVIKDNTGIYDSLLNPTGYGTPNPEFTDVESATLAITNLQTGDVTTIDVSTYYNDPSNLGLAFNLTSVLPNGLSDGGYSITLTVIGISGEDSFTSTDTQNAWIDCQTFACIAKLVSLVNPDECCCGCKDVKAEKYVDAMFYLDAARKAFNTCQYSKAYELYAAAKNICDSYCQNC